VNVSGVLRCTLGAVMLIGLLQITGAAASVHYITSDLQAAINAATPGDTLQVAPGTYGKIVVDKSLNLIGDRATIRAGSNEACIMVKADDVNITGFTVRNGLYGIHLDRARGCVISDNTAIFCEQPGIALLFSDNNVVKNNNASFNGIVGEGWYGIYLSNSNGNIISENIANNNGEYGICLFPSCNNNIIRDNYLERNDYGIYMFTECSDNLIDSNRLSNNGHAGIKMLLDCHKNSILNNTISGNAVSGVSLMDSGNNTIKGNYIADNDRFGVQIQDGLGNVVANNNISGSKTGISVLADGNHIYSNRIFDNAISAEDRGANLWYSTDVGGNFWGDYSGADTDGDGFGDAPYEINEFTKDIYPVMGEPFLPIKIIQKSITPGRAQIGDQVKISVAMESKYGLAQLSVRAHSIMDLDYSRYIPMESKGDNLYEGVLATALMDEGRFRLVLTAKDNRGTEFEETLGEVELIGRGGWDFNQALSQMS
jgi:nitrous oxidase accessory protein